MKRVVTTLLAAIGCIAYGASAHAQEWPSSVDLSWPHLGPMAFDASKLTLGPSVSTMGVGAEVGYKFTSYVGARASVEWAGVDYNASVSGINYGFKANWLSGGVTADLYPFQNGFRLSAGARFGTPSIKGTSSSASIVLGGKSYALSQNDLLTAKVDYPSQVLPYVGLGYEAPILKSSWLYSVDAGAIYLGSAKADLTTSNSLVTAATLGPYVSRLNKAFNDLQFYPLLQLGVKYKF